MRGAAIGTALILLAAGHAAAQEATSCELVRSRGTTNSFNVNTPQQVDHVPFPVFECEGGLVISADSAVYVHAARQVSLFGNVVYEDTIKSLRSDFARYTAPSKHLAAEGNVVLRDLERGSTIRGPVLDYFEAMEGRPQAIAEIPRGRPRTEVVQERVDSLGVARMDTTIVDADGLQIVGENEFHFRGDVVITGAELTAESELADVYEDGARLVLIGQARARNDEITLSGDTVTALRTPDTGELEEVIALVGGRLEAEQIDVAAPRIRALFEDGQAVRLYAVSPDGTEQANATSPDFMLRADSIEAISPAQQIEQVIAIGGAYGERRAPDDSARITIAPMSAADSSLAALIAHDWVRGDTIQAFFAAAGDSARAAGDTARVLERIVALGAPASSAYRMADEEQADGPPAINYLRALRIDVALRAGAVETVEAEGEIRGIYLQPPARTASAPPPDGRGGR